MAEDYGALSHAELYRTRDTPGADQATLAPLEHQAFAREYATESPFMALGLLAGIPGYQAAKALGLMGSRTGASNPIAQMMAGYKGLGQGWLQAAQEGFGGLVPSAGASGPTGTPVPAGDYTGASPIDRRGPYFGAPPGPVGPIYAPFQPAPLRPGPGAVNTQGAIVGEIPPVTINNAHTRGLSITGGTASDREIVKYQDLQMKRALPVIPGYEREFGVINRQAGGLVPHQGLQ